MLASVPLYWEYEEVLKRPSTLVACGIPGPEVIDAFLDFLALHVLPVDISCLWRPQLNDPKDEMVLEAAVNGGADFLLTHNIRDSHVVPARFGVGLATPGGLMQFFKGGSHAQE